MTEEEKIKLLGLYPEYSSVLGPYLRKDGRKHIVLNSSRPKNDNKLKTISYPKALMEVRIGRRLDNDETVDHINGDYTDNSDENLQILSRVDNAFKGATKRNPVFGDCVLCGKTFELSRFQIHKKKEIAGPFCTKSCRGKYKRSVQLGGERIERNTNFEVTYTLGV